MKRANTSLLTADLASAEGWYTKLLGRGSDYRYVDDVAALATGMTAPEAVKTLALSVLSLCIFGSLASFGAWAEQSQSPPAREVAADALTAAERSRLVQASQAIERKCLSERVEAFDVAERVAPGSGPLFSGEFYTKRCSCLAAEFAARATPALYRRGTAQQVAVLIRAIEDECTSRELKKTFLDGSCSGFRSVLGGKAPSETSGPSSAVACRKTLVNSRAPPS